MSKKIILLHALKLHEGPAQKKAGNFYHMINLAPALMAQMQRVGLDLRVLVDEVGWKAFRECIPESHLILAPGAGASVWHADRAVVQGVRKLRPSLYHRPTGQLPFSRLGCRSIAGIADLNFRWLPTSLALRIYKEISYRWTLLAADRVVCISQFTRDDVISKLHADPQKLRVVHHGVPIMPEGRAFGIEASEFWLTFGHQAHKNVELCLHALAHRSKDFPQEKMVVVGSSEHIETVLKPLCHRLGIANKILFVGSIPSENLSWLYSRATALLFMSRFEGFGLPVLEAMQAGCPVICSGECSLSEVSGQAALQVPVDDWRSLSAAMSRIGDSDFRKELIIAGREQARQFTWANAAAETVSIYRELL